MFFSNMASTGDGNGVRSGEIETLMKLGLQENFDFSDMLNKFDLP